jgi:hypothetical protein
MPKFTLQKESLYRACALISLCTARRMRPNLLGSRTSALNPETPTLNPAQAKGVAAAELLSVLRSQLSIL